MGFLRRLQALAERGASAEELEEELGEAWFLCTGMAFALEVLAANSRVCGDSGCRAALAFEQLQLDVVGSRVREHLLLGGRSAVEGSEGERIIPQRDPGSGRQLDQLHFHAAGRFGIASQTVKFLFICGDGRVFFCSSPGPPCLLKCGCFPAVPLARTSRPHVALNAGPASAAVRQPARTWRWPLSLLHRVGGPQNEGVSSEEC
ncbi:unnamed protein product, partial [Prorocentrum cordatum]